LERDVGEGGMGHRERITAIRGARLTIICAPIPDYESLLLKQGGAIVNTSSGAGVIGIKGEPHTLPQSTA
jgi:hypothetical protein